MEELSHKKRRMNSHVPRALQCSLLHGLCGTKYPDDTMKALGIFDDVELVLKNMHLEVLLSSHGILQGAHLIGDGSHSWLMESRGWSPLGSWRSCLASTMERDQLWNFKESELQRVWATIADGVYSSSRSKAAQIRSPVLRYVHKALANTFFARKATGTINEGELKFLDMGIKPISHAQAMARGSGEIDQHWKLDAFP
ncbi:unnamed protein product [Microthlaspi erraticum]|uniref:Arabidopsis retrotransposon Orf1 C-terminal domain-containing protein n=1 Tax=Microthlaspi erraticum TaxID=1685480 RepID=A0A6D2JYG0_9BRAS|nr:unnamed protein product [Microthlaspi erraticum]